jgi:arylformamidase
MQQYPSDGSDNRKKGHDNDINNTTIWATKFYDLTHVISQDMATYPGEPQPEFHQFSTIEKDKVNVTRLVMVSHTGTHADAPIHFLPNGKGIDKVPLDRFIGEAVILDVSKKGSGHGITDRDLKSDSDKIRTNDILLIYTGTSDLWGKTEYVRTNFSYLEPSAAEWVVDHGIKCVGIDSFSMEKYGFKKGLTHEKLLSNGIGIIEGLNSKLKEFVNRRMFMVCLPLPLHNVDGSPVRAIIFETESSKKD